ncbi:uncharacterized protein LOC113355436 [Papaver somniferum]|uniref:uncharacterized protein LOC113355436 n=1 Tax=Papaver somniferum TaxID=3469 RepID=UPI000E6F7ABC|nr:uncharacterized protein LOC113355436 [Papaver somniferum]
MKGTKQKESIPALVILLQMNLRRCLEKKQNGGIRGYSSHMSKKQVETAVIGVAALQQRDDKNALKLSKIEGELGSLGSAVKENLNCLKRKEPTSSARVGTPSPEKGSNSLFGHPSDDSLDHADSLINETPSLQVEMLDNRGKVVASGCIVGGDIFHSRKVMPTEKRVLIEEVHDQSALVWDAPQGNGWVHLRDLEMPAWVIWSADRLQPMPIRNWLVDIKESCSQVVFFRNGSYTVRSLSSWNDS